MALIKCKECGKEFSDKANACIHCGCPIDDKKERQTTTKNKKTLLVVGGAIILTLIILTTSLLVNNKIDIKGSYYYNNKYIELNSNGNCFYENNEFGFTNIDCNYSITNNNSIRVQYTSQSIMDSDSKYTHTITFTIIDDKNLKDENNHIYKKQ